MQATNITQAYTSPMPMVQEELEGMLDVEAVGNLTLRLAQLLAEEVDYLDTMRIQDIAKLHEEKIALIRALEKQQQLLQMRPEMMSNVSDASRERLHQVIGIFQQVLSENHRRLQVARQVNNAVVEAIKDAIQEHASRGIYSVRGTTQMSGEALSISLNNVV